MSEWIQKDMKKLFIFPILLALIFSSVEVGSAGVRPDLNKPNQGIRINEGFMPRVNVPVIFGSVEASNPPILRFCSDLFDEVCTKASYITATSHLPPCDATIKVNCISTVYAVDETGKTTNGKFIKLVPESGSRDFPALVNNNLPQGKGQGGVWQLPGITHSGGNDNYYVTSIFFADLMKASGVSFTNQKFKIKRLEAVIGAVNEQSGSYSPQFALDASNPSEDGSPNGGTGSGSRSGAADQDKCLVFGVGTCQMPQNFPKNLRFGISIVLGERLQGWFHGRIYKPQINITNDQNGGQTINIEAEPVIVPTIEKLIPTSQISEELRTYLSQDKQFGQGGGYLMPGSSGEDAFDQAKLWIPLLNDKASTSQSVWTVRTLEFNQANWNIRNCSASSSQLSGVVTTNSLVYSAGPPAYNPQTQTLDYKLISPHLNADETEAIGTYDLVIKSEVARCIYGFSNAPIQASISIVGSNGENKVATTVINEKNGWLYLSANGFTYSSPLIKVKLSQAKNQKYSISCVKGKVTKKVTGTKPKCPAGFKIK
jgi:hypothetical protein